jgi:Major Facilitator Superfamily
MCRQGSEASLQCEEARAAFRRDTLCMPVDAQPGEQTTTSGSTRLAVVLAMAMFVLVVDTSLMNVSISAVVHDLHTTVSGVQSAIALEALVSAAFILISSKVGDIIGRKRAFVLGLIGYAIGAFAMTLAQSLGPSSSSGRSSVGSGRRCSCRRCSR